MRHFLLVFLGMVTTCSEPLEAERVDERGVEFSVELAVSSEVLAPVPTSPPLPTTDPADPYAAWPTWCEGALEPCQDQADCAAPDRTGRARKCIKPWWSPAERYCAIGFMGRAEVAKTKAKLQRIVMASCGRRCDERKLGRFLGLVASRESGYRWWKQHRLDPDVAAARTTWARARPYLAGVNPYYRERGRWAGWGWLGQQSATFSRHWDPAAPPEILCRPAVAVATYLNCARRSHIKQRSLGIVPTWTTIHASCSLGDVRARGTGEKFERRARSAGLDPDELVELEQFGSSPGPTPEIRNATLALLEADLLVDER